jgi:hypothetical protein
MGQYAGQFILDSHHYTVEDVMEVLVNHHMNVTPILRALTQTFIGKKLSEIILKCYAFLMTQL